MPVGDAVIKCRARRAVSDYIARHRDDAVAELDFYRAMPALRHVIKTAALAHTADGGKHPHQWWIPCNVLREFGRCLSRRERDLREAPFFDELHRVVREVGDRIHGSGVLTVYDTSLRIGVKRDLLPTRVYLHRGAMSGAGALGIERSCPIISVSELPEPFEPHEIEDCLCIFKELLSGRKRLRARGCLCQWSGLCPPDPLNDALALLSLHSGRSPPTRRRPVVAWSAVATSVVLPTVHHRFTIFPTTVQTRFCLSSK